MTPAVEIPKDTANGDYTTTFCLAAAKAMKMNPRQVAQTLIDNMALEGSYFTSVELAGPGFLNFRLGGKWYADTVSAVESEGEHYGENDMLAGKKYMVEFVSANPTGPMHMGNARGGVLGDTLASVLCSSRRTMSGREFYVNDAGNQIDKFAQLHRGPLPPAHPWARTPSTSPRTATTATTSGSWPRRFHDAARRRPS